MTARLIVYFSLTFFNIPDRSIPTDQILVAVWILHVPSMIQTTNCDLLGCNWCNYATQYICDHQNILHSI